MAEIAVVMVLNKEGTKFHAVQRSDDKKVFPGLFCIGAGGVIDEGETPLEGAKRELKEELGVEAEPEPFYSFDMKHPDCPYETFHYFIIKHNGPFKPCQREFKWCGWKTIKEIDEIYQKEELVPDVMIAFKKWKEVFLK